MKKHTREIKKLNAIYSEMVEAIVNKPGTDDYERARIYFENVVTRMNGWAIDIKDVIQELENQPLGDMTADNRPA
ncbi:MAG: hypothetical protein K9I69_03490 [Ignavibacteriales bacterium]|nr:hypothetical protein [Ignavibacteriales bacterium]MCF8307348.1 hypothetical protein [Ignavibacteriales bacterium]MCF8316499.1 hypothetical protein [Ignavibacteriales bacterium]MCF8437422.1 hypothetical protein [Ignavibacteriales bacterium]